LQTKAINQEVYAWNDEKRFHFRCELDAVFFHLYGLDREEVEFIMETFPIVKRKDEAKWGSYKTRDTILKHYDKMHSDAFHGIETEEISQSRKEI